MVLTPDLPIGSGRPRAPHAVFAGHWVNPADSRDGRERTRPGAAGLFRSPTATIGLPQLKSPDAPVLPRPDPRSDYISVRRESAVRYRPYLKASEALPAVSFFLSGVRVPLPSPSMINACGSEIRYGRLQSVPAIYRREMQG